MASSTALRALLLVAPALACGGPPAPAPPPNAPAVPAREDAPAEAEAHPLRCSVDDPAWTSAARRALPLESFLPCLDCAVRCTGFTERTLELRFEVDEQGRVVRAEHPPERSLEYGRCFAARIRRASFPRGERAECSLTLRFEGRGP